MPYSLSHGKPLDTGDTGIDQDALPPIGQGPLNLACLFDPDRADQPIELEIGSGKGTFLVNQATAHRDTNYIGIEYARAYWRHAADRCRRHNLQNVRLIHTEAAAFLRQHTPDGALTQVHIYFPDPWPKARHNKRRLIQAPFLRLLHTKLVAQGLVQIVTDHTDYFDWIRQHVAATDDLFEVLPFTPPVCADQGELVGTNFERKYRRQGRPFNALTLKSRTTCCLP